MTHVNPGLSAHYRGFRDRFLSYEELTQQLTDWAEAFPQLAKLTSLGTTPEGREIWLLTVGPDPDRIRPAVWVDGNLHASELAGSSVALAIAEDALRIHLADDPPSFELSTHVQEILQGVLFYIAPRLSPDGAEAVLSSGSFIRSVPRDARPDRNAPRWRSADLDGDGLALVMRKEDPTGEYVESGEVPGLLVPRQLDDPGPYYKLYPEGLIEGFDGRNVPSPHYLQDNYPDLNRNFPWSWVPEPAQAGAGSHPGSEPESRAVIDFVTRRPHIFAWLNLHTFGGVLIRPRGDAPDIRMHPSDLALYRQLGEWAEAYTGYPMVSGFEEFTYEPEKPLRGDLSEWAYAHRGCVTYVTELWDLFAELGHERPKRFVEHYDRWTREDLVKLAAWDKAHNEERIFRPWKRLDHPQLGEVEVGGIDARFGLWNPPEGRLAGICQQQSALWLRVAALTPRLALRRSTCTPLSANLHRIEVTVDNEGYLPTYILSSARELPFNEPLWATLIPQAPGIKVDQASQRLGHLDGWGRGRGAGDAAPALMRSRGTTGSRTVTWTVEGQGEVLLRVGSCRVGWTEARVQL